jgi:hypothetical protein
MDEEKKDPITAGHVHILILECLHQNQIDDKTSLSALCTSVILLMGHHKASLEEFDHLLGALRAQYIDCLSRNVENS